MDPITIIKQKATAHQERYKSFDLGGFVRWAEKKTFFWQLAATSQSITTLNRQRRYESWAAIQDAGRVKYTLVPPEDGPL